MNETLSFGFLQSRSMRALLVAVLVLSFVQIAIPAQADYRCYDGICIEDPPPPPEPDPHCNGSCIPGIHPEVDISGVVTDTRGSPIQGASVYWQYGSTTTNSAGAYTITVWADKAVTLTANHPRYLWQSAQIANPIVAKATGQNFRLPFLLTATASPSAFNGSTARTLTIHAYSTAPTSGVRVVMTDPSGALSDLAYDTTYTSPDGWSRWTGTLFVAAGTADGTYSLKFCVLQVGATGNCDTSGPLLLSQVRTITYKVDSVGPTVSSSSPGASRDVLLASSISVSWQDPLAGMNAASLTLSVDGVSKTVSVAGGTASASVPGLAPGIHQVVATARDQAGNFNSHSFEFTLVSITAGASTATLREVVKQVNPNATIPPPSTVSFASPIVDSTAFLESINASTWVGYGNIMRPVSLGVAEVVFQNETGIPTTVAASIPAFNVVHRSAVLAPSDEAIRAQVPSQQTSIPAITVLVPNGYNTLGSSATLKSVSAPLQDAVKSPSSFLPTQFSDQDPPVVTASAHDRVRVDRSETGFAVSTLEGTIEIEATITDPVSGQPIDLVTFRYESSLPADGEPVFKTEPTVTCNGVVIDREVDASPYPCLATGRSLSFTPTYISMGKRLGLFSGFRLYVNPWIYRDSTTDRYLSWIQTSSVVEDLDCYNGRRGTVSLLDFDTKTSQLLLEAVPATGYSAWRIETPWNGYTAAEANTPDQISRDASLGWVDAEQYQNAMSKSALVFPDAMVEPTLVPGTAAGPVSAEARWALRDPTGQPIGVRNSNEQLVVGAAYVPRSVSAPPSILIETSVVWNLGVNYATCS